MFEREIFTIGHSNHSIEYFLELLEFQEINCVIDVRSVPASNRNPQFNKQPLEIFLKRHRINYLHFGEQFGARHEDIDVLDEEGIVNFEAFRRSFAFQQGVERVEIGLSKGFKIVLMCSEGNPLECHRFSMISVHLEKLGIHVKHILKDKTIKSHFELEKELLKKYELKICQPSLFEPTMERQNQLKQVYKFHNKEIGWQSEKYKLMNDK
jgi:uncharacterized protein (DUF488 family)